MLHALSPLLAGVGVDVPVAGRWHGHGNLVAHPGGMRPYRAAVGGWAELAREVARSPAPAFAMSSERFTGPRGGEASAERLAALAETAGLSVQVVGYVRPQWQVVESAYAQAVATGWTVARFDDYAAARLAGPGLDYAAVFGPWRRAFGRVAVFPLETADAHGGLLRHFLGVLRVRDARVAAAADGLARRNVRPGALAVAACRLVGVALRDAGLDRRERMALAGRLRGLPARLAHDAPFAGLCGAEALAVEAEFADANARFATDYGIAGGDPFRGSRPDPARRANRGRRPDLAPAERRYVLARTGVALAAGAGGPAAVGCPDRLRGLARRARCESAARAVGELALPLRRARWSWLRRELAARCAGVRRAGKR